MQDRTPWEQLAGLVGAGDSEIIPAILELLADEDEARILLAAAPPATVAELSEKAGMAPRAVEERIEPLFGKGLLFKSRRAGDTRYYRARHLVQLHDATAVSKEPSREMLDLWKRYMATEWKDFSSQLAEHLPGSMLRVIPVNVSVESGTQILAFDDVHTLVDQARRLAVTRCSCRAIDGACGMPLEVCIQIDKAADYAIERGTGREIDRDQALALLERCEEEGLIHTAENRKGVGHVICNCCRDCCLNWTTVGTGPEKLVAPSRFRASVDAGECMGCGLCLDRCFFDALALPEGAGGVVVEEERCMGCGLCRVVCPTDAIGLEVARPEEFVPA